MNIVSGVIEVLLFYYLKISMDIITLVMLVVVIALSFFFYSYYFYHYHYTYYHSSDTGGDGEITSIYDRGDERAMEDSALAPVI